MEGRPQTNPEQDRVLAQGRSSGECQRLKSDILLSLSVWHSTWITIFPRENILSEASSLTILSLTVLILCELFTLSLSFTLSFGAVAALEFTSLSGAPVTHFHCVGFGYRSFSWWSCLPLGPGRMSPRYIYRYLLVSDH